MKLVVLDGRGILDRAGLHDALAQAFSLPEHYGRNLDALFDCLTDIREETEIFLLYPQALEAALDRYARVLQAVLERAQEENCHLHLFIQDEEI